METAKRQFALLLVFALVFGLLPISALASETEDATVSLEEVSFEVNPRYDDIFDEGDLEVPEFEEDYGVMPLADYVSENEAAAQIREYLKARTETFTVYVESTNSDSSALFRSLLNMAMSHTGDPQEGDYLQWQYGGAKGRIWSSASNGTYSYRIEYAVAYYTTAEQESALDAEINKLLATLNLTGKSDYEKVWAVYDYICKNVTYDYTNLNDSSYTLKYTAYAALMNGTAVCQGYSMLMYRLLLELDIDTRYISGFGNAKSHGWNIIEVDDQYYNADATWDAGAAKYSYFLRCNKDFSGHTRSESYDTAEFNRAYPMSKEDYDSNKAGWVQKGSDWYYFQDGEAVTGWQKISKVYYYFNADGVMQTGWLRQGSNWYYLKSNGAMATGWQQIGSSWYYFSSSGAMQKGWLKSGNNWYYLQSSGAMATGWYQVGSSWYYFNASGVMQTGWLQQGSNWYYLNSSGVMVTGTQVIGGRTYRFSSSGVWIP